jgi:hypothetical protein
LAIGAIAGALLPSTRKEAELLAPLGNKVGDAAKTAVQAAREAGQGKLEELASNPVSAIIDNALKVAGEAGSAAARSVRQGGGGSQA